MTISLNMNIHNSLSCVNQDLIGRKTTVVVSAMIHSLYCMLWQVSCWFSVFISFYLFSFLFVFLRVVANLLFFFIHVRRFLFVLFFLYSMLVLVSSCPHLIYDLNIHEVWSNDVGGDFLLVTCDLRMQVMTGRWKVVTLPVVIFFLSRSLACIF